MLSLLPAAATIVAILFQQLVLAAMLLLFTAAMDIIDGAVARATKSVTKKGAYLDTIVDRYVECGIGIALLFVSLPAFIFPSHFWIALYIFGSLMTTYAKAAAKEKELTREELRGGLLERAERLLLLVIGLFAGAFNPIWLVWMLAALAILANISALQRVKRALQKNETI
jgi:phosphatidylglycerophosphate synthase